MSAVIMRYFYQHCVNRHGSLCPTLSRSFSLKALLAFVCENGLIAIFPTPPLHWNTLLIASVFLFSSIKVQKYEERALERSMLILLKGGDEMVISPHECCSWLCTELCAEKVTSHSQHCCFAITMSCFVQLHNLRSVKAISPHNTVESPPSATGM